MFPSVLTGADWKYLKFIEEAGIEFRYKSDDYLYEAWIMRKQNPEQEQPIFKLLPNLQEYPTGDLYHQHPTKPGLWAYHGRVDDILGFLTEEKTNPVTMEQHISKYPEVRAVIVAGTLRFQAALLVELIDDKLLSVTERAEVIERLWPIIQEANEEFPAHAKIAKSHIVIISPDKLMQRAGKGTILKKPTLELNSKELDAYNANAEKKSVAMPPGMDVPQQTIDVRDTEKVAAFIRESIAAITS